MTPLDYRRRSDDAWKGILLAVVSGFALWLGFLLLFLYAF